MNFKRVFAVILRALVILALSGPVMAQSSPRAAPTGDTAQSQELAPAAAPTTDVDITQTGGAAGPEIGGISVVSLFLRADPLVKAVMLLLLAASLWSWTIIINKALALGTLRRRAAKFEKTFWSGQSLDELYQQFAARADHPMAAVFVSALREWRRAFEHGAPRDVLRLEEVEAPTPGAGEVQVRVDAITLNALRSGSRCSAPMTTVSPVPSRYSFNNRTSFCFSSIMSHSACSTLRFSPRVSSRSAEAPST